MPKMVLHRDYVLVSKSGHAIGFKKGVAVNVPPSCYQEAVAIGAVDETGAPADVLPPEKVVKPAPSVLERTASIEAAFDLIVEKNERYDFTASGMPTAKAVGKLVDFAVETNELKGAWHAYREKLAAKKEEAELAARSA